MKCGYFFIRPTVELCSFRQQLPTVISLNPSQSRCFITIDENRVSSVRFIFSYKIRFNETASTTDDQSGKIETIESVEDVSIAY